MDGAVCPIPLDRYPVVTLAHGGGGRLMAQLVEGMFVAEWDNPVLRARGDSAQVGRFDGPVAITTDGYVVDPLFFPGGDIGRLAVYGTCNDLAVAGARPRHLTLGFILEEGLPMEELWAVVQAIGAAADHAGITIVGGDTKVVERGRGHRVFVTTTGLGEVVADPPPAAARCIPGDVVIVSGDLGRHGATVMAVRGDWLDGTGSLASDAAPLWPQVEALLGAGVRPRAMRDLTRGGLAAALHELAAASATTIRLHPELPVDPAVRGVAELLGLDAIHLACEGRFVAVVTADAVDKAVDALRDASAAPAVVGEVVPRDAAPLLRTSLLGVDRVVDLPSGEQLPRIC